MQKEEINKFQEHLKQEAAIQSILANTYKVFDRESIYSKELEDKTLIITMLEISGVNKLWTFEKNVAWLSEVETGNVILSGPQELERAIYLLE